MKFHFHKFCSQHKEELVVGVVSVSLRPILVPSGTMETMESLKSKKCNSLFLHSPLCTIKKITSYTGAKQNPNIC